VSGGLFALGTDALSTVYTLVAILMKPKRKLTWLKWTLGAFAVVLAAGFFATRDVWEASRAFDSEVRAARKEGALLTRAEILASIQIPPEKNATPLFVKVGKLLNDLPKQEKRILENSLSHHLRSRAFPKTNVIQDRNALLTKVQPFLDFADQLESKTEYISPFVERPDGGFDDLEGLRTLIKALCVDAEASIAKGNLDQAARRYSQALYVTEILGKSQIVVANLVRVALHSIIMRSLRETVLQNLPNSSVCEMAQAVLNRFRPQITPEAWFRVDVLLAFPEDDARNWMEVMTDDVEDLKVLALVPPVYQAWRTGVVQWMRDVHRAIQESKGDMDAFAVRAEQLDASVETGPENQKLSRRGVQWMVMPLAMHTKSAQKLLVERELTLATLDVVAFRQENQRWPASLPVARIDRFSKQPLRCEVRAGKPVLWSVGPNGKDEGGVPRSRTNPNQSTDDIIINF
jgi:hypothetical protein